MTPFSKTHGAAGKKGLFLVIAMLVMVAICYGQSKKRSAIQWKPSDCTSPLMLPEGLYDLSQFGKGQYRIDGKMSAGHFNCIYFIFQPGAALNAAAVAGATESSFMVKDTKVTWRRYQTIVEVVPSFARKRSCRTFCRMKSKAMVRITSGSEWMLIRNKSSIN
jgi:hypothetical protein